MKGSIVVAGWALTAAAAFLLGRGLGAGTQGDEAPATADQRSAELARRVEELTDKLIEERSRKSHAAARRDRPADEAAAPGDASSSSPAEASGEPAAATNAGAFSIEGLTSGPEISRRLMTFVDTQLARGPEGYAAILGALNTLWRNEKVVKEMFNDETTMTRELYPWVRTLVKRERQMLDLSEYVFRTMAEKPEAFADTPDDHVLEIFTEAIGVLLPGAIAEERLARFRVHATQILATPEAKQPEALRRNRGEIERLLTKYWAPPTTADEALAKLRAGGLSPDETSRLLRLVPAAALADIDFNALIEPCLRAGDSDALQIITKATPARLDLPRLDRALIQATDADRANSWLIASYFEATGRERWSELRPFFDHVLALGDAARTTAFDTMARHLASPGMAPDKAYVEGLLSRGNVPDAAAAQLRERYGIK